MNVKKAVAAAAGGTGALVLGAVVGLGHFAGQTTSDAAGTHAKAVAARASATPVSVDLAAFIYGDSANAPATSSSSTSGSSSTPSYVDDSSSYTSTYGDGGSTSPASSDGTTSIYGDGSSIYGDGTSSIYGDSSPGTQNTIYGD